MFSNGFSGISSELCFFFPVFFLVGLQVDFVCKQFQNDVDGVFSSCQKVVLLWQSKGFDDCSGGSPV